jgi:hypothetical protein
MAQEIIEKTTLPFQAVPLIKDAIVKSEDEEFQISLRVIAAYSGCYFRLLEEHRGPHFKCEIESGVERCSGFEFVKACEMGK